MIWITCENCGRKFGVTQFVAGKKGRCPKCEKADVLSKIVKANPFLMPRKIQGGEPEPVPERKLPWVIDIFLYPANKPGMTILGIVVIIPLLFKLIVKMFILLMAFAVVGFLVNVLLALYLFWYFCECVRDSAGGGLRAPETMSTTPGFGELLLQLIRIIACSAFLIAPVLIYGFYFHETEFIFWLLLACAGFFLPIVLLAVVMFDSFSAFNPFLIIESILSTFIPYCGLVLPFYGLAVLYIKTVSFWGRSWVLTCISDVVFIYLLMVLSHLLGRFYWKYQEKLNWEV